MTTTTLWHTPSGLLGRVSQSACFGRVCQVGKSWEASRFPGELEKHLSSSQHVPASACGGGGGGTAFSSPHRVRHLWGLRKAPDIQWAKTRVERVQQLQDWVQSDLGATPDSNAAAAQRIQEFPKNALRESHVPFEFSFNTCLRTGYAHLRQCYIARVE